MKLKFYFLVAGIFLSILNSFSQGKEFNFINYTQDNGLPSNESYFVYRDSRDFLWFATDKGVVRYDGNKMENFDLPDNVVFKIREDNKGRIWFFSHTGKLAYFLNGIIYPYKYNDNVARAIKNMIITDAYVDSNDNIFINSSLSYNFKISSTGAVEKFLYTTVIPGDNGSVIIKKIGKQVFFSQVLSHVKVHTTANYIFEVENNNRILKYSIPLSIPDFTQYGCVTTGNNDILFFSGKNIIKFKADGSYVIKKLPARILCMYTEKGGNIWIGLEKTGAVLINPNLDELYVSEFLGDKSISSINQDYEGGIWFSTLENGIYYLKNMHINHLVSDSSLTREVFRLFAVNDSILLYANQNGIYSYANSKVTAIKKIENYRVHDLFANEKNDIFLAAKRKQNELIDLSDENLNHGSLIIFSSSSEIVQPFKNNFNWNNGGHMVSAAFEPASLKNLLLKGFRPNAITFEPGIMFADKKNQLWLGTINTLYKINPAVNVPIPFKDSFALFKKGITCMRQMDNGIYTIGIRFGGIALMKDTTIIGTITESDGLLNNSIKYLLPLRNQLWVATPKGISVIEFRSYTPLQYKITTIGKNEGFYNLITNQLVQYRGDILAATSNGIYFINKPWEVLNEAPETIPLYINNISYYKGDTNNITKVTVPYNKSRIVVSYNTVCFNNAEKIKYYYRFDNVDTTWHEIASSEILMENLIAGNYNLEIKAAVAGEQRFSEIKKLRVIVEKPWWQNIFLWIIAFIFLFGTIYIIYERRVNVITRREQQNTALNARMAELEQMALRSQMNPHFIFNCLTSIQQLIISGNKNDANEYLVKFARLIRKTLELSASSFITIDEEISYMKEYLVLEQLRLPGQFKFSISVDENINTQKTEIPGMMLQPIVENSIRHGIKHLENKMGQIDISLTAQGEYILCTIIDNGVGRTKSGESKGGLFRENKSYGMEIVSKRISAITFHHKNEGKFNIEDLVNNDGSPAGTKIAMQLPFKIK